MALQLRLKVGVVAATLFGIQQCANTPVSPVPQPPRYSVVCVLSNAVSPNRATIHSVAPMDSPLTFVDGAEVVVRWEDDSVRLVTAEVENHSWGGTFLAYTDTAMKIIVLPGRLFLLRARCPDGTAITGQTTVPGDFHIKLPQSGDTLVAAGGFVDTQVRWSKSASAGGYVVEMCSAPQEGDSSLIRGLWHSYAVFGDSCWSEKIPVPERYYGRFTIKVMAFDANYYEHLFGGVAAAGLENAFGVMGSALVRETEVVIQGERPPRG